MYIQFCSVKCWQGFQNTKKLKSCRKMCLVLSAFFSNSVKAEQMNDKEIQFKIFILKISLRERFHSLNSLPKWLWRLGLGGRDASSFIWSLACATGAQNLGHPQLLQAISRKLRSGTVGTWIGTHAWEAGIPGGCLTHHATRLARNSHFNCRW